MKTKIVGILVCMLLIATALPAVGTMNEKEIPERSRMGDNSLNQPSIQRTITGSNRGGMFIQLPTPLEGDYNEWFSAPGSERQVWEDFWDVTSPICDVHWWGEYLLYDGGVFYWLDPENMRVNITFYEDDGGQPGAMVCSYIDVKPSVVETGLRYFVEQFPFYYFSYDLDPSCELSDGWVSIESTVRDDNGWLLWMNSPDGNNRHFRIYSGDPEFIDDDLSLVLTDGEPADPDLECDGTLSWTDVETSSTVTGSFDVANIGDATSILHWKIESYPDWGVNWTFTPYAGIQTIDMGWVTVDVEVVAPEEQNEEFTGEIQLVNAEDPSDYCIIDVSLATPKNKVNINTPFLRFLQQQPHMFPVLRHLLGL